MERKQFTFYSSFASALSRIKSKAARCDAYDAICNYALTGAEPDIASLPEAVAIVFDLIRPTLDTSRRKSENGKSGGRAKANRKQTDSKTQANGKQTASEGKREATAKRGENAREKEVEGEVEGEKEKEVENECSIPPVAPFSDRPVLQDALDRWLAYKRERRETYQETSMNVLVSRIRRYADTYGDDAVVEVIDNSIASRYQGITFDRLKRGGSSARIQTTAQPLANQTPEQRRARLERMGRIMDAMGGGES